MSGYIIFYLHEKGCNINKKKFHDDNKYHFRRHFLISAEMHLKYKIFFKTFHG